MKISVKYDVISSYWLIVSNTSWDNMATFNSINNNNYIMDTTKLLVKIGKKFRKIGLLGNQKPELKFSGTLNILVRISLTILLTQNFGYPNRNLYWFGYLNHEQPY